MKAQYIKYLFFYFLLIVVSSQYSFGQHDIPIGTWRTHLSYKQLDKLIIIENKIYAAGENSFLYYDKEDNSINTLSKINGFGDVGVSAMAYDDQQNIMLIGYESGTLDLMRNNEIVNKYEIRNAPVTGSKKINHILIHGSTAYLSTDFGLVVFNIKSTGIREIYRNLGIGGNQLSVFSSTVFSDSLFLTTSQGIMSGPLDEHVNLMDHLNWRRYTVEDGIPEGSIKHFGVLNSQLYAGVDMQGLYLWNQSDWSPTSLNVASPFNEIKSAQNQLIISLENDLYTSSGPENFTRVIDALIESPGAASMDSEGKIWIADRITGLISNLEGSFRSYSPDGPLRNDVSKLYGFDRKMLGLSGGHTSSYEPQKKEGSFYILDQGQWINFAASLGNIPPINDLMDVTHHSSTGKLYFASFGSGILEWDQQDQFTVINEETVGSTLQSWGIPSSTYITGIEADTQDKIWITNYGVTNSLHSFDPENSWEGYAFTQTNSRYPLGLTISSNGDKWLQLRSERGAEILVFNEASDSRRLLTNTGNEGALLGEQVSDIVQDNEGLIWIGSNQGISYVMNPFSVLSNEPVNVVIPRYDGGFLLRGENVTTIKVDGGNRKWIGTTRGLWLFDGSGEALVHKFTIDNSPLPSNNINDIEIDDTSGEVFIATDKGLISYRGTATKATRVHQKVKIFPNPVRASFTGQLGISGLTENANVKITDISGRLIRQLYAEGGTAVWDINDNRGRRVSSGVYLVLSASEDGEETFVGKLAVIE